MLNEYVSSEQRVSSSASGPSPARYTGLHRHVLDQQCYITPSVKPHIATTQCRFLVCSFSSAFVFQRSKARHCTKDHGKRTLPYLGCVLTTCGADFCNGLSVRLCSTGFYHLQGRRLTVRKSQNRYSTTIDRGIKHPTSVKNSVRTMFSAGVESAVWAACGSRDPMSGKVSS